VPFSWNPPQDLEWGSSPILPSIKTQSERKVIPYEEEQEENETEVSSLMAPNFMMHNTPNYYTQTKCVQKVSLTSF
jgi:hypothetical protein